MALRALAEALRAETSDSGLYVGLAYVGLTQNEPGKTIYDINGNPIPKVDTKGFKLQPIHQVADGLIHMMEKRRFIRVFTFLGKLTNILNRISPTFVQFMLTQAYKKRGW
jgi:short-subunit dehydrogenase